MSVSTVIKPGIRKERCLNKEHSEFIPQPHQENVVNYFINSPHRGLLLYHLLGSGKTCTSILVANKMLEENKIKHVFVLTPGSLRTNWIYEYCNKCGDIQLLRSKFTFITYNYNIFESVKEIDFNDSLIIIDEAHNLINGAKNLSKNPFSLYIQILNSNARILILTATVIFNNTFEWCLLGNLLKDNTFPNIIKSADEVDRFFFDINKDEIMNEENMKGIVSYFAGNMDEFPDVIYNPPIKVLMSPEQDFQYNELAFREDELRKRGPPKRELLYRDPVQYHNRNILFILSQKYIISRSISNIYYPLEKYERSTEEDQKEIGQQLISIDKINYENVFDKVDINEEGKFERKKKKDVLIKDGGWMDKSILENKKLLTYSPKIAAILINIIKNLNSKHVIFSFFIENCGLRFIHNILRMCGIKSVIYSGDVSSEKRQRILNRFNNKNNLHGEKIKVLLLTEAGGEGITLLEVGHIHILESNTVANKVKQVIGRAVRYKSHLRLPKEERVVNVWKYHSYSRGELFVRPPEIGRYADYELSNAILPSSIFCEQVYNIIDENPDAKIPEKIKKLIIEQFKPQKKPSLDNFKDYYNEFIKTGGYKEDFEYNVNIKNLENELKKYLTIGGEFDIQSMDKYLHDRNVDKYEQYQDFYDILIRNSIEKNNLI